VGSGSTPFLSASPKEFPVSPEDGGKSQSFGFSKI